MDITDLINETIAKLAEQPSVFSVQDVAASADLNGWNDAIGKALCAQCNNQVILSLDQQPDASPLHHFYLGKMQAERWWAESTLRWANAGVRYLTPAKLAGAMSLAFDTSRWDTVPASVLEVGRQWAMVADGYDPHVLVFPWAVLLNANPQGRNWFRQSIDAFREVCDPFGVFPDDSDNSFLASGSNEALSTLPTREAAIIRGRLGLDTGQPATLEQLGNVFGVTRERIRQIEKKAWRKLRHPMCQQRIWSAYAADFIQSRGSLLVPISSMLPTRIFFHKAIELNTVRFPEIGFHFIGNEAVVAPYRNALQKIDKRRDSLALLPFLSEEDGVKIRDAELLHRSKQAAKTRPRMLREALRSLGRAAHYEEIAAECYRLFPECRTSVRSLHAALSAVASPANDHFGIVWIGRRGMYGLSEHGYSRPDTDLFDGVANIVEIIFRSTQLPVSQESVITEMAKQRRELQRNSVVMALAFNDRLHYVGSGEYVPLSSNYTSIPDSERIPYDIDAAFAAFSVDDATVG